MCTYETNSHDEYNSGGNKAKSGQTKKQKMYKVATVGNQKQCIQRNVRMFVAAVSKHYIKSFGNSPIKTNKRNIFNFIEFNIALRLLNVLSKYISNPLLINQ